MEVEMKPVHVTANEKKVFTTPISMILLADAAHDDLARYVATVPLTEVQRALFGSLQDVGDSNICDYEIPAEIPPVTVEGDSDAETLWGVVSNFPAHVQRAFLSASGITLDDVPNVGLDGLYPFLFSTHPKRETWADEVRECCEHPEKEAFIRCLQPHVLLAHEWRQVSMMWVIDSPPIEPRGTILHVCVRHSYT